MFNLVLSYLQYTMGVISVAEKVNPSITSILCEHVGGTIISEWVICSLTPTAAISWREQLNFQWDDDEVHFVLDQHA
jgi:hypothetical protein